MTKVTMQQIADKASVSKCMVSLALSDKYGVNVQTKAKIISAAAELGYDFKQLRTKSKSVAVTVLVQAKDLVSRRYWPQILKGVAKKIKELDYTLYSETISDETYFSEILIRISERGTKGIVVLNHFPDRWLEQIQKMNLPIVLIDSQNINGTLFDQVRVNNGAGCYEATRLLLENGHRNICFVGNREYSISFKDRYFGFNEAVSVYRDEINSAKVCEYRGTDSFGKSLFKLGIEYDKILNDEYLFDVCELYRLLKNNGRGITAMVCANDIVAEVVHDMCTALGYNVPTDISIIGFDNINVNDNKWINEQLSSVAVPIFQMGERAVSLLAERINSSGEVLHETVLLSTKVVNKKSVRNLLI